MMLPPVSLAMAKLTQPAAVAAPGMSGAEAQLGPDLGPASMLEGLAAGFAHGGGDREATWARMKGG